MDQYLITAKGKIKCLRCTANTSRTGEQCARPALKTSKTQKCQFHGGRGSGPKTEAGKLRIAAAHMTDGQETRALRFERSSASARLSQLEDSMHVLGLTNAPRIRGRKAKGYEAVQTFADVMAMVVDDFLHRNKGVVQPG